MRPGLKRSSPARVERQSRHELLRAGHVDDVPLDEFGLELGNRKTGSSSAYYASIRIWNVPPVVTCPGASEWCLAVCYNGDARPDVFRRGRWLANLRAYQEEASSLKMRLIREIKHLEQPSAIRIHSSGDFHEIEYIRMWVEIVATCTQTNFWAYTRSWTLPELLGPLEALRQLRNIQLFASWDESMKSLPPRGWRRSYVKDSTEPPEFVDGIECPEEITDATNCAVCRFCIKPRRKDVIFHAH